MKKFILLGVLFAGTPSWAAEYPYIISWIVSPQPPGVVLTGHKVEWYWCGDPAQVASTTVAMPSTSTMVVLPLDRYCWTVRALTTTAQSDPSALKVFHSAPDSDDDGVLDNADNCLLAYNTQQTDSDADGFGNRCDGDMNNNGFVNSFDAMAVRAQLGQPSTAPGYNPADFNANGFVNSQDVVLFRQMLGSPPGPSAVIP